jgi:general secretion pathway protein K
MMKQRGIALAIVVWFIAGMSLLVVGMVSHVRVDTQMAQAHVARAKAVAAGDGAIQLMLADRLLNVDSAAGGAAALRGKYRLGNAEVTVTLYPATGFINIDTAPQKLLAALFLTVGQVSEGEANALADNVVKWRGGLAGTDGRQSRVHRFEAIEDLLRVEGMHRTLFDAIRDFIVVGQGGGGATDWVAAPAGLLPVLEQINPGEVGAVGRRREQMARANSAAGSADYGPAQSLSGSFRADAVVKYGDQEWMRRRWVSLETSAGSSLPWHFTRTEPPRAHQKTNGVY